MGDVDGFKYLGVWFERKLRGNVHLEKMENKAEEKVGKVMWMFRMNGQVEVDIGWTQWELMGKPSVECAAEVWW